MQSDFLYRNDKECISMITFKTEEISRILELAFEDFGSFMKREQWESVVLDGVLLVNSLKDKQVIYLLQLACADIVAPIRKDFMKHYVQIEANCKSKWIDL